SQNHMQVGDQGEGDRDGDAMRVDLKVRKALEEMKAPHKAGDHGLADPAKCKADHGDAELDSIHNFVEVLMQALDGAGAETSGPNELLDAGIAHADEREFRGCEERVGCHEEEDQEDPEQHEGEHGWVILAKQGASGGRWVARCSGKFPLPGSVISTRGPRGSCGCSCW